MTQNQRLLASCLERLQSIESGKNYGPVVEVEALADVAEELYQLSQDILSDKLQALAQSILDNCPSIVVVADSQGLHFIKDTEGNVVPQDKFPVYNALQKRWDSLFGSYSGVYVYRKVEKT